MQKLKVLVTAGLLAAAGVVLAHGDAKHTASKAASEVRVKEQKDWGIAGDVSPKLRTIAIEMSDAMRFGPQTIQVRKGETVRIKVRNTGTVLHEMVIGTRAALEEHADLMRRFPNMEHDEPYIAHVAPGDAGEIVWTFNRSGTFEFACLIPGHYEAGMAGTIQVAGK